MLSKNFKQVKNKKNLSFYPKKKNTYVAITKKLLENIKLCAKKNKKNIFLCLHNSPKSKFHNFVVFLWKGTHYITHKHKRKEEVINMIYGKKRINLHYKKKIVDKIILDTKNNSIVRINRNILHSVDVLSNFVIYHEIKPGPFNAKNP